MMQSIPSLLVIGHVLAAAVIPPKENELNIPAKTSVALSGFAASAQNVDLQKKVTGYYYYSCPHGGPDSRVFTWEASFSYDDHLLHMQGRRNIDSIDHITVNNQYFNTYWHHSTCVYELDTVCFYAFRGYTFGHIGESELAMDLVTNSDDPDLSPRVWESCVAKHAMPKNFCSISYAKHESMNCEIEEVDAFGTV